VDDHGVVDGYVSNSGGPSDVPVDDCCVCVFFCWVVFEAVDRCT
jgi:hypothetical protein